MQIVPTPDLLVIKQNACLCAKVAIVKNNLREVRERIIVVKSDMIIQLQNALNESP